MWIAAGYVKDVLSRDHVCWLFQYSIRYRKSDFNRNILHLALRAQNLRSIINVQVDVHFAHGDAVKAY